MTTRQLETRLDWLERQLATAHPKSLPAINATIQKILDRLVALDLAGVTDESELKVTEPT